MAEVISKNARTAGSKTQSFYCSCGGQVKMISIFTHGKINVRARCEKCNREERSPKNFTE
jgi:hypothetical protein